jgi:adhesin/invasin
MRLSGPALALLAAGLSVPFGLSGCGGGVPLTAPGGASLTIEALPKSIPAVGGASTITVLGFRAPEDGGGILPNGTQIYFTTDLGFIEDRASMQDGIARATLRSTGRTGTATVTAVSGGGIAALTTTVQIGAGPEGDIVISVTANPSTLGPTDFSSEIVATLTDNRGNPLADVPVIFSTTSGALASNGTVLRTNINGQAFDRLTLLDTQNTATVTVTSGSASGTATVTRGDFGDPILDSVAPSSGVRGAILVVAVTGQRFQAGATASLGAGIVVFDVHWVNSETLLLEIHIDPGASTGARTLTVTNPDGGSATLASIFVVL